MCTLIIARNIFDSYPIVVAANRDEVLDRPSGSPELKDHGIFSPRDLQRGGTWVGVNSFGVFVGITNRNEVKSVAGRKSRGEIVMNSLMFDSAYSAFQMVDGLDAAKFNAFHLVIIDQKDLFLVKGNGSIIESTQEKDGLLVVTNYGIGRLGEESSVPRVQNVLRVWKANKLAEREPSPDNLSALLDIHDEKRCGTCINEPDENYGTKSSSIVRLYSLESYYKWNYFHRERSSKDKHICAEKFSDGVNIPIDF